MLALLLCETGKIHKDRENLKADSGELKIIRYQKWQSWYKQGTHVVHKKGIEAKRGGAEQGQDGTVTYRHPVSLHGTQFLFV